MWVPSKQGGIVEESIYKKHHTEESVILQTGTHNNWYTAMWSARQLTPQSHDECMMNIVRAVWDLPAK